VPLDKMVFIKKKVVRWHIMLKAFLVYLLTFTSLETVYILFKGSIQRKTENESQMQNTRDGESFT
jgi:hypothetical protein